MVKNSSQLLDLLFKEIQNKIKNDDPEISYTAFLAKSGIENIAKKVVEEAFETAMASIDGPNHKNSQEQVILETSDLFYHILVLLASKNIDLGAVMEELEKRMHNKNLSKKAISKNKIKLYGK